MRSGQQCYAEFSTHDRGRYTLRSTHAHHGRSSSGGLVISPTRLSSFHLHPGQTKTSKSKQPFVRHVNTTRSPPSSSTQSFRNRQDHYRLDPQFTRRIFCRPLQTRSYSCSCSKSARPLVAAQGLCSRLVFDLLLTRRPPRCIRQLRPHHSEYLPRASQKHGALADDSEGGRLLCK